MSHKSTDPGRVFLKHALAQSGGVVIVLRAVVRVMTRPHDVDFCHQHKSNHSRGQCTIPTSAVPTRAVPTRAIPTSGDILITKTKLLASSLVDL